MEPVLLPLGHLGDCLGSGASLTTARVTLQLLSVTDSIVQGYPRTSVLLFWLFSNLKKCLVFDMESRASHMLSQADPYPGFMFSTL